MFDWFRDNPALSSTLVGASVLMFILGLVAMPFIVCRIPADYFAHEDRPPSRLIGQHRAIHRPINWLCQRRGREPLKLNASTPNE